MRVRITPGSRLRGEVAVPGDKSIAHRWLILASSAQGPAAWSTFRVPSTCARRLRASRASRSGLDLHSKPGLRTILRLRRVTVPRGTVRIPIGAGAPLEVEGEGRSALVEPARALDCGNSGTAMRLLAGVVAGAPVPERAHGRREPDRPSDGARGRSARAMGADVAHDGRPRAAHDRRRETSGDRVPHPRADRAGEGRGPAGRASRREGTTTVEEPAPTRDHTERALRALGAPVQRATAPRSRSNRSSIEGFDGAMPGRPVIGRLPGGGARRSRARSSPSRAWASTRAARTSSR